MNHLHNEKSEILWFYGGLMIMLKLVYYFLFALLKCELALF